MDRICCIVFLVGVLFLVVTSILNWMVVPEIVDDRIKKEVRLINGSETWHKWQHIPVPIYLKFYVFNVTNPDEVERGRKPVLQEAGPYTYRESRVKFDINTFPFDNMVSYKQNITYFFEATMSNGSEQDKFNVINVPFVSLAYITNNKMGPGVTNWVMWLLHVASLGGESLIRRNVIMREFLFDGIDVSLYSKPLSSIQKLFPSLNIELPLEFQNNKFAVYNGRNGTDEGVFTISSGVESSFNFGEIFSIDGKHELSYWDKSLCGGNSCNQINGSDGTLFHPFITKNSILYVFSNDLCRSVPFVFDKEIDFEGVPGYRFLIRKENFQDPRSNPDNLCYCPGSGGDANFCLPQGFVRLSSCKKGAPIVLSLPHFLDGDKNVARDSIGLKPNRTKHETYLHIEPSTGLSLQARKRIQFNVELKKWPNIEGFQTTRDMIFPFVWAEESADLDVDNIEEIKSKFLIPLKIFTIGKWVLIGVGSAITLISFFICTFCRKVRKGFNLKQHY